MPGDAEAAKGAVLDDRSEIETEHLASVLTERVAISAEGSQEVKEAWTLMSYLT